MKFVIKKMHFHVSDIVISVKISIFGKQVEKFFTFTEQCMLLSFLILSFRSQNMGVCVWGGGQIC